MTSMSASWSVIRSSSSRKPGSGLALSTMSSRSPGSTARTDLMAFRKYRPSRYPTTTCRTRGASSRGGYACVSVASRRSVRRAAAVRVAGDDLPHALPRPRGRPEASAQGAPLRGVAAEHGRLQLPVGGDADAGVILQLETALSEVALPGRDLRGIFHRVRKLLVDEDVGRFPLGQDQPRLSREAMVGMPQSQRYHPSRGQRRGLRSEEHTPELQARPHIVCRLPPE